MIFIKINYINYTNRLFYKENKRQETLYQCNQDRYALTIAMSIGIHQTSIYENDDLKNFCLIVHNLKVFNKQHLL